MGRFIWVSGTVALLFGWLVGIVIREGGREVFVPGRVFFGVHYEVVHHSAGLVGELFFAGHLLQQLALHSVPKVLRG